MKPAEAALASPRCAKPSVRVRRTLPLGSIANARDVARRPPQGRHVWRTCADSHHITLTPLHHHGRRRTRIFIKIFSVVMGMYGLQMLAVPAKMVTDHFDAPATPLLQFWIRGSSCAFLTIVYLVKFKLTRRGVSAALAMSVACGALYPWNAKFGYLARPADEVPVHYVPEVLMVRSACLLLFACTACRLRHAPRTSTRRWRAPPAVTAYAVAASTLSIHAGGPHGPRHRGHDASIIPSPISTTIADIAQLYAIDARTAFARRIAAWSMTVMPEMGLPHWSFSRVSLTPPAFSAI